MLAILQQGGADIGLRFFHPHGITSFGNPLPERPTDPMVPAPENVDNLLTEGDVLWLLGNHQGTIQDVVEYNHPTDETDHLENYRYDSYGNLTAITEADGVTVISTDRRAIESQWIRLGE